MIINSRNNKPVYNGILVSFFNSNNLGDILIGDMLSYISSKYFGIEKISFTRPSFVNSQDEGAKSKNKISILKEKILHITLKIKVGKRILLFLKKIRKLSLDDFERKIKDADLLIIGGGNMIFDLEKHSFSAKKFSTFVAFAKRYNKKVFAISLGIGPFKTKEQEIQAVKALSNCNYITFRDNSSYEIFRRYNKNHENVFVAIDPVFLLPKMIKGAIEQDIIALNIINNKLMKESEEKYLDVINQYAKLSESLVSTLGKKVVLYSTEIADYKAVYDVYRTVNNNEMIGVQDIFNVQDLMDLYSNTLILIGTRMHSMIIAYTQRIPIIGLSWQQKVDSMFEIINSTDSLFKYNEINKNLNQIIQCAKYKIDNLDLEKDKIETNLKIICSKMEINERIFKKLLNELEEGI